MIGIEFIFQTHEVLFFLVLVAALGKLLGVNPCFIIREKICEVEQRCVHRTIASRLGPLYSYVIHAGPGWALAYHQSRNNSANGVTQVSSCPRIFSLTSL